MKLPHCSSLELLSDIANGMFELSGAIKSLSNELLLKYQLFGDLASMGFSFGCNSSFFRFFDLLLGLSETYEYN